MLKGKPRLKNRNAARGSRPSRVLGGKTQAKALSYIVEPYALSLLPDRSRPAFGSERALSKGTNGPDLALINVVHS